MWPISDIITPNRLDAGLTSPRSVKWRGMSYHELGLMIDCSIGKKKKVCSGAKNLSRVSTIYNLEQSRQRSHFSFTQLEVAQVAVQQNEQGYQQELGRYKRWTEACNVTVEEASSQASFILWLKQRRKRGRTFTSNSAVCIHVTVFSKIQLKARRLYRQLSRKRW